MITVVFKETKTSFRKKVNEAISDFLNRTLNRNLGKIVREIRELIPSWIESQPEMIELATNEAPGSLAAQFGLPAGTGKDIVNKISNAVRNSLAIRITKINKKDLSGGVELNLMSGTFEELLSLKEGHVIEDDLDLHWLDWLLSRVYETIVTGYQFKITDGGRSGGGVMTAGNIWRVPTQYAGSPEDNFITRALKNTIVENQIQAVLQRNIK
jgi:hypothetical protein